MKRYLIVILFFLLVPKAYSQEIEYLDFRENANYTCETASSEQAKPHRLSCKRGGEISVAYDGSMPDSLKAAVDAAREVWRDYMGIKDKLKIKIKYESLADVDVNVSVAYKKFNSNGLNYPLSLYRSITGENDEEVPFDAVIHINSSTKWCTGFGNDKNPKKLLPTLIKSISRCLGYGSSVKKDKRGNIFMLKNGKSVFDSLIFSEDGRKMSDLNNNMTQALNDFVQQECGYLYVSKKASEYRIYSPKIFDENISLKYSTDKSSTMYFGTSNVSNLTIDNITIDVLNSLGWKYSTDNQMVQIKCDDIDDTGIASAYRSHTFYVGTSTGCLSSFDWTASFPLKSGGYEEIKSTGETFMIPAVTDEDKYMHTLDGDIRVVISFSGILLGKPVTCDYSLTLELKPHIISANISSCTPSIQDDTYCNYTIDLRYEGSNYVYAYAEEEFSSMAKTDFSNVPYFTKLKFYDIDTYSDAVFTIRIENKYGYDECFIEQPSINRLPTKPTKPELLDVKFVYDHFDYDLLRFDDDARFEVTLYSENSDKFVIMNAPDMNINKYDSYVLLYDAENVENVGDNLYRLSAMFDFDTDIYFYAKNKYGSSLHSDSIHTNDYVTDPNIIDAINQASAIKDATGYEKSIILFHENVLSFAKEVKQVTIMDLTGRMLYEQNDNGRINLANRQKGIYVITVLTNNNKRITKKIRI